MHAFVDDRHLVEQRPAQLLGLQHASASSRPDARYSRVAASVARVQDDGEGAALRRHRGDPRRGLQPHRRRQPARPDAVASAASTTPPTTGSSRENPRYYMDYTGCGNTLNMQHPRVLQLIMDTLRYWVDRDARRRLPLRPRLRARARAARGRPPRRLLRHHPPGPGALAGEADRRAVGPRRRRLPGRQLPARLGRVERQVPRHHARLLEGRRRPDRRVRAAPHRLQRPVRAQRPPAARQHQLHHRARRLHAARPGDATTTSTTRPTARTTATATTTTCPGTAASKAPTDDPAINALRARQKRNFLATLLLSQGVPMLLGRRRARPHAERQQQRLLPGQRDLAGSTGRSTPRASAACSSSCSAHDRAAPRASGVPPARLLPGPAAARRRRARTSLWLKPDGDEMTDEEWDAATTRAASACTSPATALDETDARGRPVRDDNFLLLFNAHHEAMPFTLAAIRRRRALADRCSTPPTTTACARTAVIDAGARLSAARPLAGAAAAAKRRANEMKRVHDMPFGAAAAADGGDALPAVGAGRDARRARASRGDASRRARRCTRGGDGWFELDVAAAPRRHALPLSHRRRARRARPGLALQPGRRARRRARSSIRARYDWRDGDWRGRPWHEAVIYELHVGTFTPEGTFARRSSAPRRPGRARRHGDRADAGRRLSRAGATGATTACCRSRPTRATARRTT